MTAITRSNPRKKGEAGILKACAKRMPAEVSKIQSTLPTLARKLESRASKSLVPHAKALIIRKLLGHWWAHNLRGDCSVHPGIKRLAEWGKCSERHAQRVMRGLEEDGLVSVIENSGGGRGLSTTYRFDVEGLCRWMVKVNVNPHPSLLAALRNTDELCVLRQRKGRHVAAKDEADTRAPKSRVYGNEKGDKKGDTVSPRSNEPSVRSSSLPDRSRRRSGSQANAVSSPGTAWEGFKQRHPALFNDNPTMAPNDPRQDLAKKTGDQPNFHCKSPRSALAATSAHYELNVRTLSSLYAPAPSTCGAQGLASEFEDFSQPSQQPVANPARRASDHADEHDRLHQAARYGAEVVRAAIRDYHSEADPLALWC